MTVSKRYIGHWDNAKEHCMLCEMEKKTEWHLETPNFVVAEKLGGGPFVVVKEHVKELTKSQYRQMQHVVGLLYDDFEIVVRMNLVKDHWHGHIRTENQRKSLQDE